jgi:Flp pilus assembly protein TadG
MRKKSVEIQKDPTMQRNTSAPGRKGQERGFVLITMAIAAVALLGVLGMSVDFGRMYIAKNETQSYCDSAALAAALALDGTTTGISNAQSAVTNSLNTWNFGSSQVTSPTVTFATSASGPWDSSPNPATAYIYARVTATVALPLYFVRAVVAQTSQNVVSSATAGQIDITSFPRGLAPYTAVSTNTTGPNFGFTVGNSYDIQWPQYNSTRAGCSVTNPDKCFNSEPCSGETKPSKAAVVSAWGASMSGYWGSSSNSAIQQEILDLIQVQAVSLGTNIQPVLSNGTKSSEAGYLDQRASQDTNTTDNTVSAYLTSTHNGRRLISAPIVDPIDSTQTNVVGYGQFLLLANGPGTSNYYVKTTNGNDPFCAIYAGSYNIGSSNPGVGISTGASRVKLVQ